MGTLQYSTSTTSRSEVDNDTVDIACRYREHAWQWRCGHPLLCRLKRGKRYTGTSHSLRVASRAPPKYAWTEVVDTRNPSGKCTPSPGTKPTPPTTAVGLRWRPPNANSKCYFNVCSTFMSTYYLGIQINGHYFRVYPTLQCRSAHKIPQCENNPQAQLYSTMHHTVVQ